MGHFVNKMRLQAPEITLYTFHPGSVADMLPIEKKTIFYFLWQKSSFIVNLYIIKVAVFCINSKKAHIYGSPAS